MIHCSSSSVSLLSSALASYTGLLVFWKRSLSSSLSESQLLLSPSSPLLRSSFPMSFSTDTSCLSKPPGQRFSFFMCLIWSLYRIVIISALTLSPSSIGETRTKSPLFIQTFFLNFVGIDTRNDSPLSSTTSCRLFPRPATTLTMVWPCWGRVRSCSTSLVTCFLLVALDMLAQYCRLGTVTLESSDILLQQQWESCIRSPRVIAKARATSMRRSTDARECQAFRAT